MGIGTALGTLAGVFGWNKVRNGRNGGGLSPSSKAIVKAIETTETSNQRRHDESMKLQRQTGENIAILKDRIPR